MEYDWETRGLEDMIGAKINNVAMSTEYLAFDTDKGTFGFCVVGDCCSWSYFYDFHGVHKLLVNGPVVSAEEIPLEADDYTGSECVQAYGYRIITESPVWGEQSSVFSFRNESNGYYGGWMEPTNRDWTEFFQNHELNKDVVTLD
jgi:hypothetical protein